MSCVAGLSWGCEGELYEKPPCLSIPEGGCPARSGVDGCSDRSCAAVYLCTEEKTWLLQKTCPENEAGAPVPGEDAGDLDAGDALADVYVPPDAPPGAGGGAGCRELQNPDCSLAFGMACAPQSCCGCEELFVCRGGGWESYGLCEDGVITPH